MKLLSLALTVAVSLGALAMLGSCCLTAGEPAALGDIFSMSFLVNHNSTAKTNGTVTANEDSAVKPAARLEVHRQRQRLMR